MDRADEILASMRRTQSEIRKEIAKLRELENRRLCAVCRHALARCICQDVSWTIKRIA